MNGCSAILAAGAVVGKVIAIAGPGVAGGVEGSENFSKEPLAERLGYAEALRGLARLCSRQNTLLEYRHTRTIGTCLRD